LRASHRRLLRGLSHQRGRDRILPATSVIKLTGARSVCTDLKSLGTALVSLFPPIVPAPTPESRAASWLNQWWDGLRTGYAYELFDGIQRVLNQRE
jgi:hypothetical protein